MRRRLFWTIAGVAAVTGLLVLIGSAVASQRAATEATYREMKVSATEVVALVDEAVDRAEVRPGAALELFRFLEGDQIGPTLLRISRGAGSSHLGFAIIRDDGELRASDPLFNRVNVDQGRLQGGQTQFTRSSTGELVVIEPTTVSFREVDTTVLVGIAREAPVVRLVDQFPGMMLIVVGIALLAAVLARVLSTQVARRLEPLAVASRGLANGDLTVRVPDLGDPELDEVAGAFNEMATELEATATREREFILGVGHDLRTPLTTIGGYAEALEAGEIGLEDLERIGGVIHRQSKQLGRLIEDLSTLARLEQPQFSLRVEKVDVGAHVAETVEGFRRRAEEVGVSLVVNVEEGLVVDTDPDRVGQIAQNLVENALRFTPETGTVEVSVERMGGRVVLSVADTGVGIAPEDLPHVFDRHYMGRHRQVRHEGSGLGLSIVDGLVTRMGGEVIAESAPGKGTTIAVSFPA